VNNIFCAPPALIALNDSETWFENAVALAGLIERGHIEAVYCGDAFAGFVDTMFLPPMLAPAKA
jgi:hypothetical protein